MSWKSAKYRGSRERESLFVHFETCGSCGGETRLPRRPVPAPRRQPHAGGCADFRGRVAQRRKARGEVLAELPQPRRVVPAVVEQEGIHLHAACPDEVLAIRPDYRQRFGLGVWREIADVVPGVVVQERAERCCALVLQVSLEAAAQLTGRHCAEYGRIPRCHVRTQRQRAPQPHARVAADHPRLGHRVLEAEKRFVGDDRRAAHAAENP